MTYDVTNQESFHNVQQWLQEIQRYARGDVQTLLVGNKADLHSKRQVSTEQGQALAESLGMEFLEASAKTGTRVEEAFLSMAKQIKAEMKDNMTTTSNSSKGSVSIKSKPVSSRSSWCFIL